MGTENWKKGLDKLKIHLVSTAHSFSASKYVSWKNSKVVGSVKTQLAMEKRSLSSGIVTTSKQFWTLCLCVLARDSHCVDIAKVKRVFFGSLRIGRVAR